MRLTLRTLLALLDNLLPSADAVELNLKVEESEFAQGLVHRIRTSTRRERLAAPPVEGKGVGLDANTVAEYLDNVLPASQVPELEKVCLESDVHLAEVAGCHQILAIVLGQPAEVSPELRERCYRIGSPQTTRRAAKNGGRALPERHDGALGSGAGGGQVEAGTMEPEPPPTAAENGAELYSTSALASRQRTTVPDYLKAGKGRPWKPLLIALTLAFALSAVALRAMGPFDRAHPLVRLLGLGGSPPVTAMVPAEGDSGDRVSSADALSAAGSQAEDVEQAGATRDVAEAGDDAPDGSGTGDGEAAPNEAAPPPDSAAEAAALANRQPETDADPGHAATAASLGGATPSAEMVAGEPAEGAFPPTQPAADSAVAGGGEMGAEATSEVNAFEIADTADTAAVEVGSVKLSDMHFFVRQDAGTGNLYRLPARTRLMSGEELIVLPTYRPEIVLTPGVQAVVVGPARVRLLPPSEQGDPGLHLVYGGSHISTAGVAGARLNLLLGDSLATLTFADPASEIAIDVRRYLPPGGDPLAAPAASVVHIFATAGRVDLQDANGGMSAVEAGQVYSLIAGQARTATAAHVPAWVVGKDVRDLDRLASLALEPALPPERSLVLSLNEQSQDRKVEVRSLAACSLAYLGSYEALIGEFSNDRQRAYWPSEFDTLRDCLTHDPANAARFRVALEQSCPNEAAILYPLLCGFSPQQLNDGAAAKLVDLLDHESLNVRVLAFENLSRITGKTHYYRPELTDARRRASVQEWRKQLESGAIQYASPPGPLLFGTPAPGV